MVGISLVLVALAFAVSFGALRKKNLSVRILSGMLPGLVLVGLFLTLIIIGGDPAQPGAATCSESK